MRARRRRGDGLAPYLYVAPFFVLFGLVGLFPLVYTFVVSLNDWDLLGGPGDAAATPAASRVEPVRVATVEVVLIDSVREPPSRA